MAGNSQGSRRFTLQEINSMPLLGLKLQKSESLFSLLESRLAKATLSEKLKASSFPLSAIRVGNWKRVSKLEGELTGKVYYAKKRLVWELLVGRLKIKMEISWSDITAIQAVLEPNQSGYLQIELANPPLFYRETTPQPRKHTNWQQTSDFTNGEAPICRRHIAMCPPGALDKHYEKLLRSDEHLFQLSQRPFPTHNSPYFNTVVLPSPSLITFHHPQQQQSLYPTMTAATSIHNGVAAVWENQINNEAKFVVNTSRPNFIPHQQQPPLYPTMASVTARNNGVAAMWENQINNEAKLVDTPRPNFIPHHQLQQQHYEYEYNETNIRYMDASAFNQNPTIHPMSISAIHGLSDEHLMQNGVAVADGERSMLLDQMMRQNADAAVEDGGLWSLVDQTNFTQNSGDVWLGDNAVADDSWLAPYIQGNIQPRPPHY
ncbi:uncharacterized protein LOC130997496 [Salvia miltiorrhiza]|uniref:uncharacterized protein LOC130997496 n=1 Tax=Salvia miltiorrhiza TaxID=226208 RepID=UPI0025AD648E|nr:uncharacterized protein LOC130997496 [Salvia miltiorrhiza]